MPTTVWKSNRHWIIFYLAWGLASGNGQGARGGLPDALRMLIFLSVPGAVLEGLFL